MNLNTNLNNLEQSQKVMLKTFLQTELNEFLQEKMETELFENVEEQHKSEFIGEFFQWMRTVFVP